MSLVPEREAFKGRYKGLARKEILYGKLSASRAKEESQENNKTESLVHRELPSTRQIDEEPTRKSYDSSSGSPLKLDAKARLDLREVLRLSIGNRVNGISEEDLDDLGVTFLEATVIALKARQSRKEALSEVP